MCTVAVGGAWCLVILYVALDQSAQCGIVGEVGCVGHQFVIDRVILGIEFGAGVDFLLQATEFGHQCSHFGDAGAALQLCQSSLVVVHQRALSQHIDIECGHLGILLIAIEDAVGIVSEGKFSHLLSGAAHECLHLNLEVLILCGRRLGELEEGSCKVGSGQLVLSDVSLFVEEHPSLCVLLDSLTACEVASIYLPGLPVAAGIVLGVVCCNQLIECRSNGLAGREYHEDRCIVCSTPLGLLILIEEEARSLVCIGLRTVYRRESTIDGTLCHVVCIQLQHLSHGTFLRSHGIGVEFCIGHDIGIRATWIEAVGSDGLVEIVAHNLAAIACDAGVVLVVQLQVLHGRSQFFISRNASIDIRQHSV